MKFPSSPLKRLPAREDLGKALGFAVAIDAGERRMPLGQQDIIAQDLIFVNNLHVGDTGLGHANDQLVVISRWPAKLAIQGDDDQKIASVLDLSIRNTPQPQQGVRASSK